MYGLETAMMCSGIMLFHRRICQSALLFGEKKLIIIFFRIQFRLKQHGAEEQISIQSVVTLDFVDPKKGDFRLKDGSIAFSAGFKNFAMDSFGVVSPQLKALAKKPPFPAVIALDKLDDNPVIDFMGAKVKNLTTLGERSATGMDETRGVLVVEVTPGSVAAKFLQANDVILSFNNQQVNKLQRPA